MESTHRGGCHCKAIRFEVVADLASATILECNCSICTKKGFLHLIVDAEQFTLIQGGDALNTYQFQTMTAKHHFCRHCGIHPFYVARSHPDGIDVNVRALDLVDLDSVHIEPFDGRNWEDSVDAIT
jgi:hypothetical protein